MSKKSKEPSEADIVFNRANIALAKNQRLVASWLPPRDDAELASAKSQEELDREEDEMFAPVPELLGVGAVVPKDKDGLPQRSSASALDKLRIQLLGKKATAKTSKSAHSSAPSGPTKAQPIEEESDDEESRVTVITNKRRNKTVPPKHQTSDEIDVDGNNGDAMNDSSYSNSKNIHIAKSGDTRKKRSSNFMDQLLEKKSKKKKKP